MEPKRKEERKEKEKEGKWIRRTTENKQRRNGIGMCVKDTKRRAERAGAGNQEA